MQENKVIFIENAFIRREFSVTDGHILTTAILNKRIGKTFYPQAGSEDFIIQLLSSKAEECTILSSALTLKDTSEAEEAGKRILTISYEPYVRSGVTYQIAQVITLAEEESFMRSVLRIHTAEEDFDKAQIDYIDIDHFILPESAEGVWSHPDDSLISSRWIGKHELMLGQPVYAEGFFFGSEFPATDTIIRNHAAQIRYYSGKTFRKLAEDHQLDENGTFITWPNVVGAASGTDIEVVQTDFFAYIEKIATPTHFRRQYNSWYDNMMAITDESIATSFLAAEDGLTKNGVAPLDSYVVDDGWNNYYDGVYTAEPGPDQGTTPNQTGFWEFNAKFPNELYTSSALTNKFQSTFGVWIGPQGGYNYFDTFSKFLEANGTGFVQPNSALDEVVCTGSRTYLKNFEAMAVDYQKRFRIGYWKWDGFASRPCQTPGHNHMTGGENDMYFTSDMWEAWTDLFEHVREESAREGMELFINATCYINLSPWLLQWVNTIWVQDSGDTGHLGTGERHQQKIYYRDQVYDQLYRQNQVQFPLKNIYNHDPIYGVSDQSEASTEVFREFMFANAVRGTAFWELYYSPSMIDDAKWKVTADTLSWAQENHEVLKNAKLFGNKPSEGVYGYSCWNGAEGILSFTNPLDEAQTYSLAITDLIGADRSLKNASGIQVHPYAEGTIAPLSYGDTLRVALAPHQTLIYQYGHCESTQPCILSAKITGDHEITVKFSKRMQGGTFTVNGKAAENELQEDYRTYVITTEDALTTAEVVISGAADFTGHTVDRTLTLDRTRQLCGIEDFTIGMTVETTQTDGTLFTSGDEIRISVTKDGFASFCVNALEATSEEQQTSVVEKAHGLFGTEAYVPTSVKTVRTGQINDGAPHRIHAVREPNGMLKLYVDGRLAGSAYDAACINEELTGGKITTAPDGFACKLSDVSILNRAISYSEASAQKEGL